MIMRKLLTLTCFVSLVASAGAEVRVGDAVAPVGLRALEGHGRVLGNFGERKCTVVVFLSSRCAETQAAAGAIKALHDLDAHEEMLLTGISTNTSESAAELKAFCQASGFVFPVYQDVEAAAATQFGARVTPSVFLVDGAGVLRFRGSVGEAVGAIRAALAGETIPAGDGAVAGTPIDSPGEARDWVNPFGPIVFSSQLVFNDIPGALVHHCSTIAEAPNGDLLCVWYGGSYESAEDQVLFMARRRAGAATWDAPGVLINNPDQPPGNAILFADASGRLWVFWGRMEGTRPTRRGTGWSNCRLMFRTSLDSGHTWSTDQELADSLGWLPRNPPILLPDKTLLLPMTAGAGGRILRLEADGRWSKLGPLAGGEQLTIAPRDNGELIGFARSKPYTLGSVSPDFGVTWQAAEPTNLKCPDSSVCLLRLKSGRMILAHNDNDGEDRANLTIQQSEDEGRTWSTPRILDSDADLYNAEYSYPCLLQSSDGLIHISYTYRRFAIKHAVFNENWLTQLVRPN